MAPLRMLAECTRMIFSPLVPVCREPGRYEGEEWVIFRSPRLFPLFGATLADTDLHP
jgi:hypothetical protein